MTVQFGKLHPTSLFYQSPEGKPKVSTVAQYEHPGEVYDDGELISDTNTPQFLVDGYNDLLNLFVANFTLVEGSGKTLTNYGLKNRNLKLGFLSESIHVALLGDIRQPDQLEIIGDVADGATVGEFLADSHPNTEVHKALIQDTVELWQRLADPANQGKFNAIG